jgi:CubicO group peptidase (beta-lactamase class C family)
MVWGVVAGGRLVHLGTAGVLEAGKDMPVTSDSRFRIASMSKAFTALTILRLRDEGRLRLDDLAEDHVPELKGWTYPTADAPRIRVRDLLHHVGGLVEDDPWGDRQTALPEAEFTAMLKQGVPWSRVPQQAQEYSNYGYAVLGRVIRNASGQPFEEAIAARLLRPLGMGASGYDVLAGNQRLRALGHRWENDQWRREPDMGPGAFGAMGGLETTANDYARWVAFLLGAWPARDEADTGPVKRATVRELVQGLNFTRLGMRRADLGPACAQAVSYAMGFRMVEDCDLGAYMTHTGGYPGYGSVLMMVPEAGVGVFAFANRTYAAPVPPAYAAMKALKVAGVALPPPLPVSAPLADAYEAARTVWARGNIYAAGPRLAMNMLMDRSASQWGRVLGDTRARLGACDTASAIAPEGAMTGRFRWRCERGGLEGRLMLAPTNPPTIQAIQLTPVD